MPTITGHSSNSANTIALNLTIPNTASVGDVAWMIVIDAGLETRTISNAWTLAESGEIINFMWHRYYRVLTSGDPGSTVTLTRTVASSAKVSATIFTMSNVDHAQPESANTVVSSQNYAASSRPNPTTTADGGDVISAVFTRGGTPPTVWNAPSGWTRLEGTYLTGGGSTTLAIASRNITGAVGGDSWTSDTSEGRGGTMIIVPKQQPVATPKAYLGTKAVLDIRLGTQKLL